MEMFVGMLETKVIGIASAARSQIPYRFARTKARPVIQMVASVTSAAHLVFLNVLKTTTTVIKARAATAADNLVIGSVAVKLMVMDTA